MVKYKLELKPVKLLGIDSLSEDKRQMLSLALTFISEMLKLQGKITSVETQPDLSLIIEAEEEIAEDIERLHEQAILTRLT